VCGTLGKRRIGCSDRIGDSASQGQRVGSSNSQPLLLTRLASGKLRKLRGERNAGWQGDSKILGGRVLHGEI
jgi:hypothetical protein